MKIALDIHGVLDNNSYMKTAITELYNEGHSLYVLSGAPVIELEVELKELGYDLSNFTAILSIIDYLKETGKAGNVWKTDKGWWVEDDNQWWKSKAEICELHNIDYLVDDQIKYKQGYLEDRFRDYEYMKLVKKYFVPSTFSFAIARSPIGHGVFQLTPKSEIPIIKDAQPPSGKIFYMDYSYQKDGTNYTYNKGENDET